MSTYDGSETALQVLRSRYLLKDDELNVVETPDELFKRVAVAIAAAEGPPFLIADEFQEMMVSCDFLPNSPTLMNAGTDVGQLSACFVLEVGDSIESIFDAARRMAIIFKSGGGVGLTFSRLRPCGDLVASTQGISSGPLSFMEVFDVTAEVVKQGGRRRGAMMGSLSVRHPDVQSFIHAKRNEAKLTNMNTSVEVTDGFMKALRRGVDCDVVNPRTGTKAGTLCAAEVMDQIVESAWATGEPGILFIDRINEDNPVPHLGRIEASNPCAELPLRYNESCNLGSINLANMVLNVKMDWEKLRKTVHLAVRFLDDVIDVNRLPFPEIKEETLKTRKIGLGVMGWAETLVKMGIPYDSDLALDTAGAVMEFINVEALNASRAFACERGVYPEYRTHDKARNATRTVVAPTGSISIIAGVTGGIEPMFSIGLKRRNILDGQEFYDVNPLFVELAEKHGIWTDDLARRVSEVASIQDVVGIPGELKSLFKTAHDVSPERHVQMQAAFQRHVDNAVSKTVNLPADATRDDVRKVFMLANDLGCKGVTVYRDGCRANQPMTSGKKEPKKMIKLGLYLPGDDMVGEGSVDVGYRKPRKRPEVLDGKTIKLKTGCGNIFVTITFDESGNPMELFAKHGKAGVCSQVQCEAIGRLASLALRSQVDPAEVSKQLIGITCHEQQGLGSKRILSCADAIGKSLTKALNKSVVEESALNGVAARGACPECGAALVHEGNCALCRACGYTKCS